MLSGAMRDQLRECHGGAQVEIGGAKVRVGGIAKGSGMIHPNMATMLSVITSDASVEESLWQDIVRRGAINSFNQVSPAHSCHTPTLL